MKESIIQSKAELDPRSEFCLPPFGASDRIWDQDQNYILFLLLGVHGTYNIPILYCICIQKMYIMCIHISIVLLLSEILRRQANPTFWTFQLTFTTKLKYFSYLSSSIKYQILVYYYVIVIRYYRYGFQMRLTQLRLDYVRLDHLFK